MIYLKNLNGQVREYKDSDTKTVKNMIDTGRWVRVNGLKDPSPFVEPKKAAKKVVKKATKKAKKKSSNE